MSHPGIPKPNLKDQAKGFSRMVKIMRGEVIDKPKQRKPYVRKNANNDMREKVIERNIINRLNLDPNVICWKSGEQSEYNAPFIIPGMPDIGGFHLGRKEMFFIEVKSPGGVWRNTQVAYYGLCQMMGIKYILAYSVKEAIDGVI